MSKSPFPVIFTALEGALMRDQVIATELIAPAIWHASSKTIPLILCGSQTRAEMEYYMGQIELKAPFIVESGAAIYIPEDYFSPTIFEKARIWGTDRQGYKLIELGKPLKLIRHAIKELQEVLMLEIRGIGEMNIGEIYAATEMEPENAFRFTNREYSEVLLEGDFEHPNFRYFTDALKGLRIEVSVVHNMAFIHGAQSSILSAIELLMNLYKSAFAECVSIGIGSKQEDTDIFTAVDKGYLLQDSIGQWVLDTENHIERVEASGPQGWMNVVNEWISFS